MAPDLVSVTSYGLPVQISMTSLGLPNLISMTSLGLPNLVSVTIGTRIFKKKFKKGTKTNFFKIFTMFIVILRCFYIIYVKMSYQCRVPLSGKKPTLKLYLHRFFSDENREKPLI